MSDIINDSITSNSVYINDKKIYSTTTTTTTLTGVWVSVWVIVCARGNLMTFMEKVTHPAITTPISIFSPW